MKADYCLKKNNDIFVQNLLWLQNLMDFFSYTSGRDASGAQAGPFWNHQKTRMTMPGGRMFVSSICCHCSAYAFFGAFTKHSASGAKIRKIRFE